MFTLKTLSLSPSRTSLSIPTSSPLGPGPASPSSSTGRSPASDRTSCFPGPSSAPTTPTSTIPTSTSRSGSQASKGRYVSREEALRTVKAMEEVLVAWNEYRIVIASLGKSGRKLGNALKGLAGCMDKTEVAAQTIRPTAAMLEGLSDLTLKLSKKVDKEYDDANSDASKYFNLLAKESRTHDAYLGVIGKKHEKAEKAYRKASKSSSDTAGAHSGLLALKDTLSGDISRAQEDHHSLIGTKQASILLRLASSSGVLASNLLAFHSDGLRKTSSSYPDIEYFRCLADAKWTLGLPQSLEEEVEEEKRRDEIRLIKARVALGESDIVGQSAWDTIKGTSTSTNAPDPASSKVGDAAKQVIGIGGFGFGTCDNVSSDTSTNTNSASASALPQPKTLATLEGAGASARTEPKPEPEPASPPVFGNQAAKAEIRAQNPPIICRRSDKTSESKQKPPAYIKSGFDQISAAGLTTSPDIADGCETSPPIPHHSLPSLSTQASSTSTSTITTTSTTATLSSDTHHPQPSFSGQKTLGRPQASSATQSAAPLPLRRYVSSGLRPPSPSEQGNQPDRRDAKITDDRQLSEALTGRFGSGSGKGSGSGSGSETQPSGRRAEGVQRAISRYEDLSVRDEDGKRGPHESVPMTRSPNLPQPARPSLPTEPITATHTPGTGHAHIGRSIIFERHRKHQTFVRGCQLCEMDYERMLVERHDPDRVLVYRAQAGHHRPQPWPQQPPQPQEQRHPNPRRVTMPPLPFARSSYPIERSTEVSDPYKYSDGSQRGTTYKGEFGFRTGRGDKTEAREQDRSQALGHDRDYDGDARRRSYDDRNQHQSGAEDTCTQSRHENLHLSNDVRKEHRNREWADAPISPEQNEWEYNINGTGIGTGVEGRGGRSTDRGAEVYSPRPRRAIGLGLGMSMSPELEFDDYGR